VTRTQLSLDARRILAAQGLRVCAYGFGAPVPGSALKRRWFRAVPIPNNTTKPVEYCARPTVHVPTGAGKATP
jgi:hypothetical protein